MSEIHKNDIGTNLKITVQVLNVAINISGATNKRIILTSPNNRKFDKAAVFDTDGTDGILKYTSISGDFYVAGTWKIQAFVELASGSWHTETENFEVLENL